MTGLRRRETIRAESNTRQTNVEIANIIGIRHDFFYDDLKTQHIYQRTV
jgi:hypothetical protein